VAPRVSRASEGTPSACLPVDCSDQSEASRLAQEVDYLNWLRSRHCECGSQDFMAAHKFAQRLFERRDVEFAFQPFHCGHVVNGFIRFELIEKPQALLRE